MGLYFVVADDLSDRGFPAAKLPVPRFGGKLYAVWLLGTAWRGAPAKDLSGATENDRDLSLRSTVVQDYWSESRDTLFPVTPFTTNDLVGEEDALTFFTVMKFGSTSSVVNAIMASSSGVAGTPSVTLSATPSGSRISAFNTDSGGNTAVNLTLPSGAYGAWCYMGSVHSPTQVKAFARPIGSALLTATAATTRVPSSTTVHSLFNATGSPAAGDETAVIAGFYRGALSDAEINHVYDMLKAYLTTQSIAI